MPPLSKWPLGFLSIAIISAQATLVLIFLQLCGRHRRRGEKRGKETVSVFARLLVLVVACWHSGVSNGLAAVFHHCTWWKDGLCQLQPRSKRHLASYLAAADASVACTNAGVGGLNILDNGQLQEVQEGFFGHRGRGMVPVPKSGEGGWRRDISG